MKKVIGWTEDINDCECCGKSDLKGTFCVLVDEQEFYFGSVCVTKKHGLPAEETKKALKAYDEKKRAEKERERILVKSNGKFDDPVLWREHLEKIQAINMVWWQEKLIADYSEQIERIRAKQWPSSSDLAMIEDLKKMIAFASELRDKGKELEKTYTY